MSRGSHNEEWDVEHSSKTLLKDDEPRYRRQSDGSGVRKGLVFGQMFVVLNFILQLPPAVLGQLNSNPTPLYSCILMLLSHASLFLWIIKLLHRWNREKVTRADIVGLLSNMLQSVCTTVNFALLLRHTNTHIQISGWPIILAFVLLCSTFWGHFEATCWRYDLCSKITIEQVFAIVNFILELPSAVLDQLCSEPKPLYALILMLLSFASVLLCIIELLHKGKTERVKLQWLYPNKPFLSFWDKVGLICAVVQPILSTVNYALVLQRRGQVQISVLPIVFALALSCSKIWKSQNMTESEGNIDEEEQDPLINPRQRVTEPTASEEEKSGLMHQSQIGVNEEVFPKPEKSVVENDNKIVLETEDGWILLHTAERTLKDCVRKELDQVLIRLDELKQLIAHKEKEILKKEKEIQHVGKTKEEIQLWTLRSDLLILLIECQKLRDKHFTLLKLKSEKYGEKTSILEETKKSGWRKEKELIRAPRRRKTDGEKTWTVEKTKESVWRKEKELMREPTRRKTNNNALRRRVKSWR